MRRLAALLLLAASVAVAQDQPGRDAAKPSWHEGSTWTVRIHPIGLHVGIDGKKVDVGPVESMTLKVRFVVEGKKDEDKVSCYVLRATREDRTADDVLLLVREQDLTVKRLVKRHKPSGTQSVVANERTPFLLLETSSFGPLDFPLFPARPVTGTAEHTFELAGDRSVKQTTKVDAEGTTTYVLEADLGGKKVVSTIKWAKDADFWSSASRTIDGVAAESGELEKP